MTSGPVALCVSCRWFESESWTCAAYPDGIPERIRVGEDHRRPVDDEDVVWELRPGAMMLFAAWAADRPDEFS